MRLVCNFQLKHDFLSCKLGKHETFYRMTGILATSSVLGWPVCAYNSSEELLGSHLAQRPQKSLFHQ